MRKLWSGCEKEQRSEGARGRNILLCCILLMVVFRSVPGCRTPCPGCRPSPRRPAAYWSSLRPRQSGGAHLAAADRCALLSSALLLPCQAASTAPILTRYTFWCLCKVMMMNYWSLIFDSLLLWKRCSSISFQIKVNGRGMEIIWEES